MKALPGLILSVVFMLGLVGCSKAPPSTQGNKPAGGGTSTAQAQGRTDDVNAANARANVDNHSTEEWEVFVDGQKKGVVAPMGIFEIRTTAGKHEFRITRGNEEVERVEATLKNFKTVVINPKGRGSYRLISRTYVGLADAAQSMKHGGGAGGQTSSDSHGERVVEADFGLIDDLSTTVLMYPGSSLTRIKIYRALPKDFSAAEADALLTLIPHIYPARHDDYQKAIDLLTANNTDESRFQEILYRAIEVKHKGSDDVIKLVFQAIEKRQITIPDDRLTRWLFLESQKDDNSFAPARMKGVVGTILRQEKSGIIQNQFAKMSEPNQNMVINTLRGLESGAPKGCSDLMKNLLMTIFKTRPQSAGHFYNWLDASYLELDEEFVKQVDAFIAGLPMGEAKKSWNNIWYRKLCDEISRARSPFLIARVFEILQDEKLITHDQDATRSKALVALARAGEAEKILPIFKKLSVDARAQVMWGLKPGEETDQQTVSVPPLLIEGLKDEDKKVRAAAFDQLFIAATKDPHLDAIVKDAIQKESDDYTRKEMERRMASVDYMRSNETSSVSTDAKTSAPEPSKTPATDPVAKITLKVTGISTLTSPATATVNGQSVEEGKTYPYKEGGATAEYTVIRIESEKVVVRYNGKEETFSLGSSMDDFTEKP